MDRTQSPNSPRSAASPVFSTIVQGDTLPNGEHPDYTNLLARFPEPMQKQIAHDYPELEQLDAFHQIFVERGWSLSTAGVAFVLDAEHNRKFSEMDQHRVARMNKFFCKDDMGRHDKAGATPLHRAILWGDIGLIRVQLQSRPKSPAAIVAPDLHYQNCAAMAVASNRLAGVQNASERNETLVQALNNRNTLSGDVAATFTAHAGDNALTFAIGSDASPTIVALLIEHCAQHCPELLSAPDANGNPPLAAAAASGRPEVVSLLLQQKALVRLDQLNGMRRSALMEAARLGDRKTMELLLKHGASLTLTDANGNDAKQLAALCQHPSAYNVLAGWKAEQGKDTNRAHTAKAILADVIAAVKRGDAHVVAGIVEQQRDSLGADGIRAALREALRVPSNARVIRCLLDPAVTGCKATDLVDSGLELSAIDAHAMDALASAVFPTDPTQFDPARRDALLHKAAGLGSVKCVCYALDGGADVNGKGADGTTTPLMCAVNRNDRALIVVLLKRHACIKGEANDANAAEAGDGALSLASRFSPQSQARELVLLIASEHPDLYRDPAHAALLIEIALALDLPELAGKLVRDGRLNPTHFKDEAKSLLMQALELDRPELLAALLGKGAPLMQLLNAENGNQHAALERAAELNKPHAFFLILQACNVSRHDDRAVMQKWLVLAVKAGSIEACRLILDQGEMRLPRTARRPDNPLLQAVIHHHHDIIALLLEHGADPLAKHENRFKSALEKAVSEGDARAIEALLKHSNPSQQLRALLPDLLNTAAENKDHASFEALVTANPEAISVSKSKLNAMLKQAIALGSPRAFKVLLSRGAELNITAENGDAMLRAAVLSDRPNIEIVRLLLQHRMNAALSKSKTVDWALVDQNELNAATIVPFLLDGKVSDGHKLYWAAATLAEYVPSGFSTANEIHVKAWGESMKPLWKSMPDLPAACSLAIAKAVQQLASHPNAGARISFIQNSAWFLYSSMDQQFDFHPVANAMLDADCLFLLVQRGFPFELRINDLLKHFDPLPYLREDKLAKLLVSMRQQNEESIQRMKMVWLDLAAMEQNMVAVFLFARTSWYSNDELQACAARLRANHPDLGPNPGAPLRRILRALETNHFTFTPTEMERKNRLVGDV